jgi:T-complex protein 1 subunit gamma
MKDNNGNVEIDVKRYAKVEKIPGGVLEECKVLDGVMFNKDVTHPAMRREIVNPRIVLLDCPLEYKKGESMTNMEFTKEDDFKKALEMEETEVMRMCEHILRVKPDIVITEKGVSDIAQHYLLKKGNISCFRRIRKTDNNRVARVSGATVVNRPEELTEKDVGCDVGLYEVKKIGDDYFTFLTECKNPTACSILLRGASKDVLNEVERNLHDAMGVARNVL